MYNIHQRVPRSILNKVMCCYGILLQYLWRYHPEREQRHPHRKNRLTADLFNAIIDVGLIKGVLKQFYVKNEQRARSQDLKKPTKNTNSTRQFK